MMSASIPSTFEQDGFAIVNGVIDSVAVANLIGLLSDFPTDSVTRRRGKSAFARRNLLEVPGIVEIAESRPVRSIIDPLLGASARPVRGILFDKTPEANWVVPWHQDLSIAVRERIDVEGYGPWSVKAGVVHVQPPVHILHRMVTIRLHLDDCLARHGPLRVIPGSHRKILDPISLSRAIETGPQVTCEVAAGGAVVVRPLIAHASSPAKELSHRRVVHLEYAGIDLPGGLRWHAERTPLI
jgi:hypothetical protein